MSAVPTPYTPSFSFYDWSALNSGVPAPGQKFDAEFQNLKTLTDAMLARAALIQRNDGMLVNGIVGRDALSPGIATGVNPPLPWTPFRTYSQTDSVTYNGSWYWSLVDHISGSTFDPAKWQYIGTFFSADPLMLSLGKESLVDGIFSADTAGRAKMGDGYVTYAKLADDAKGAFSRAFASFNGIPVNKGFNFTFAGNVITATCTEDLTVFDIRIGSTVQFIGQTGNGAVLNGSWPITGIIYFAGTTTITFHITNVPAGAMTGAFGNIIRIYKRYNIFTITRDDTGSYFVIFSAAQADSDYLVQGMCRGAGINPPVLQLDPSVAPAVGGFKLAVSVFDTTSRVFLASDPQRVMFSVLTN